MKDARTPAGKFKKQHGFSYTGLNHPIYQAWTALRARCLNPKHRVFKAYGGRGITCCKEWDDFEVFSQEMLPTWRRGLTLERLDNEKGYSKSNCVWATRKQQARNRRNSHHLTFNGEKRTIAEWAEMLGVGWHVIKNRLRLGWPVEKILTTRLLK